MGWFRISVTLRAFRLAVAAFMISVAALMTQGCATTGGSGQTDGGASARPSVVLEKEGIRILSARWSTEGHMIDVRYEITDPEKAAKVLIKDVKPYMRHERTGLVIEVPRMAKVGRLQQTTNPPERGRVYFMLFGNNGLVQKGDIVTLMLGDTTFEGIVVQ